MSDATENTDRVLWHDESENVFITRGGGLGINCNGHVIVKPLLAWQQLAAQEEAAVQLLTEKDATISRLEVENAKLVDLLRVDIITQERDALEAENAQMRSLISSRPDAPQAFWDEHRTALESARQQVAIYNLAIDKAKT